MEVTGAVLGAAAIVPVVIKIISSGCEYVDEFRYANEDADRLANRMRAAQAYFGYIGQFLFHSSRAGQPCLFGRFDEAAQSAIQALLNEFHDALCLRYRSMRQAYSLGPLPEGLSSRSNTGLAQPTNRRPKSSRVSWVLWGRRRALAIVVECELYNERLRDFAQLCIFGDLPLGASPTQSVSLSRSISQEDGPSSILIQELDMNEETDALEFTNDAQVASLSNGSERVDWISLNLEIFGLVLDNKTNTDDDFPRCGNLAGQRVLVDFKYFQPDATVEHANGPEPAILRRIQLLAALLNRQHSSRAHILPCLGLYQFTDRNAFGYVFKFPELSNGDPVSLRQLLSKRSRSTYSPPPLESRLHLALTLAGALLQFHAVGWLHKSIRSSNIIFFPKEDTVSHFLIDQPLLVGFEYAREDSGFSELMTKVDRTHDVYRHPDNWGTPTTKFHKIHDIYSLGVVLLEIGLWKSVFQLEQKQYQSLKYEERFELQRLFVKTAREQLPFHVGSVYASVVEKCLTGSFDMEEAEGSIATGSTYQEQILEHLRMISFRAELGE